MSLRESIYNRDGGRCVYCGKPVELSEMHLEHKIPRVFGGSSEESNLLCSCSSCNLEKSSKLLVRMSDISDIATASKELSKELEWRNVATNGFMCVIESANALVDGDTEARDFWFKRFEKLVLRK